MGISIDKLHHGQMYNAVTYGSTGDDLSDHCLVQTGSNVALGGSVSIFRV